MSRGQTAKRFAVAAKSVAKPPIAFVEPLNLLALSPKGLAKPPKRSGETPSKMGITAIWMGESPMKLGLSAIWMPTAPTWLGRRPSVWRWLALSWGRLPT